MKSESSHFAAYEALAALNRHFREILLDLEVIERLGLLQRTLLKEIRADIEETRAWANFEVIDIMHSREEGDWARFSRIRRRLEQRNQSLSSVLIESEPSGTPELGRPLRRQTKRRKK
jgi:hypothetical protein